MIEIKSDLHTHTTHSWDARNTPFEMCERAATLGLNAIAFTEHAEWFPRQKGFENPNAYFADIEQCRADYALTVFSGVELGNPHQFEAQAQALIETHPFDILIGSVHWLYDENIHNKRVFRRRDPDEVLRDYFTEMAQMVNNFPLDVVAHFDRILMRAHYSRYSYDILAAENEIRAAFQAIVEHDVILELNSKHLNDRTNWNDDVEEMLRWYRQEGGTQVMVNSDSHDVGQIGRNFPIAAHMLTQLGFQDVADARDFMPSPVNHLT